MSKESPFAADLPWPDYLERVKNAKAPILIPLGSMEQHGHHMPLHVDVLLPTEFARRVALEVGGLVAPPFCYGYKSQQKCGGGNHMPGTVSLEGSTLVHALRDVLKEFARHGSRQFTIVNGHFENSWFITEAVDLALFGMHVTLTRVFWFLYSNADRAIVGKLLGAASLGIYGMAFSLATLPSGQITSLVINVASPLFAKLQHDLPRLSTVVLKMTRGIAYVCYPALLGMLVCSHELILVVLGPKWIDCQIPFAALCLMGLVKSVDPLLSQVLTSIGNVKKLAAYTALCAVVMSLAFAAGAWIDGLRGVSIAWIVVYPMLSTKLLRDVCKLTGLSMRAYYRALLPILCGAIAMCVAVLLARQGMYFIGLPVIAILLLEITVGVLTYLAWIIYVDKDAMLEIRQTLIDLGLPAARFERWPFNRPTRSTHP